MDKAVTLSRSNNAGSGGGAPSRRRLMGVRGQIPDAEAIFRVLFFFNTHFQAYFGLNFCRVFKNDSKIVLMRPQGLRPGVCSPTCPPSYTTDCTAGVQGF